MRKVTFLVLILSVFTFQSCLDVLEELSLNKDGSGTYQLTFDMAGILSNGMMKEMLKESMENEDGGGLFGGGMEVDTLIAFKDSPMAQEGGEDLPEILKQAQMKMEVSESKGVFESTLMLDFKDVSEIKDFYSALEKAGESQQGGFGNIMPKGGLFSVKKKTLTRKGFDTEALKAQMNEGEGADMMAMMRMMMSGAKYTVVYNFPKKVKKTTIEGAQVDGKKVTVSYSYLDVMEGKAKMEGTIKYK